MHVLVGGGSPLYLTSGIVLGGISSVWANRLPIGSSYGQQHAQSRETLCYNQNQNAPKPFYCEKLLHFSGKTKKYLKEGCGFVSDQDHHLLHLLLFAAAQGARFLQLSDNFEISRVTWQKQHDA